MKTMKFNLMFVLLAVIYCCSTNHIVDPENELSSSQELVLEGNVDGEVMTRKNGNSWDTGDLIGVYAWNADKDLAQATVDLEIYNRPFITTQNNIFRVLPGTTYLGFPSEETPLNFIAYYPYVKKELLEDFIYPIDVADQSNIDKIDFLFADNLKNVGGTKNRASLKFKHQLSRLHLKITSNAIDLKGTKVILKNVPTRADFNLIRGGILNISTEKDITAHTKIVNGELIVDALVIPNEKLGQFWINIVLPDGTVKMWQTKEDWKWVVGTSYSWTISINKSGGTPEDPKPLPKVGYFETPLIYKDNLPANERYVVKLLSDNNTNTPGAKQRNFAYLYDIDHKISYWVAYPMHPYYLEGSVGRNGTWTFDPELDSKYQVNLKSGYINWFNGMSPSHDRGHQIASGDRQRNEEMNNQTFYSPNVTPQQSGLNQKIWQQLEDKIQGWTKSSKDTIYVVTGAGFTEGKIIEKAPSGKKGANNLKASVPHYYYKVLAQKKGEQYRTVGFFFEHRDYSGDFNIDKYRFTVKEIEDKTGYTFFPGLDDPKAKEQDVMW